MALTISHILDDLADDGEFAGFEQADVYILPLLEDDGRETDEDSGDEEGGVIDNLNRHQLLAGAQLRLVGPGHDDEDDMPLAQLFPGAQAPVAAQPPQPKRSRSAPIEEPVAPIDTPDADWESKENAPPPPGAAASVWPDSPPSLNTHLNPDAMFEKFFTPQLIDLLCAETTRYAQLKNRVVTVTREEMYTFLGILIFSGYWDGKRRAMYWDTLGACPTIVAEAMSRNRFDEIMQSLHIADNAQLDPDDRFAKMRPLLNYMNDKCLENWLPERTISIDESMVPYYGRHGAKQYMHAKPVKFGYKMWVAATRLGYAIQFYPYAGKGDHRKELGLGGTVVARLLAKLPNKPYHVIFDNFLTSQALVARLNADGKEATGTLRANRCQGIPLLLPKVIEKEPRGTFDYAYDRANKIQAVRWNDNRPVTVLSTFTGVDPVKKCKRYNRSEHRHMEIDIPDSVFQYNWGMGGVDRLDQNIGQYMINLRTKKWWWPIFRFCVDMAVTNAFYLFALQPPQPGAPKVDALKFRRLLAYTYLGRAKAARAVGSSRQEVPGGIQFDGMEHWPEKLPKQRRCARCHKKVNFGCTKCGKAMHIECFQAYHTPPQSQ